MPKNIDEVINELEGIIQHCIITNNKAGYFAALYLLVTKRVKEGILNKEFEDGPRMELLDVIFANRYLKAYNDWLSNQPTTASWAITFDVCAKQDAIIIQHLLLGMNAHINLDLGIAAVETMKGYDINAVKKDYNSINNILSSFIDNIESRLSKVSPLLYLLKLNRTHLDEMLVTFSINTARRGAWEFALMLNEKIDNDYINCINERDKIIASLATNLSHPAGLLNITVELIRASEYQSVAAVIDALHHS